MPAPSDDPLHAVRFSKDYAPVPLLESVEKLASDSGRSMPEMEGMPLGDIFALACSTYGKKLPEFWRVWKDWHEDERVQDMGDL